MAADNHYDVLGVEPTASPAEVRKAYLSLARTYHPDFYANESPSVRDHAEAMMRDINAAWAVVGSSAERSKYDRKLGDRVGAPSSGTSASAAATAADFGNGSAPPRWLTMMPMSFLAFGVISFAVGMVTGLPVVLLAAVVSALLGAIMFVVVPVVALKRAAEPLDGSRAARARA